MTILTILFFAISSSVDNLVISLNYGIKNIKINLTMNILIASISCVGTALAMIFGKFMARFINPSYSKFIGASILIILGLYMLSTALDLPRKIFGFKNLLANPETIDKDHSKSIELKEAILLGGLLCLNNIGLGIGASIVGLNILFTSITSFVFSFTFIKLGYTIGNYVLSTKVSYLAELFAALIVIILGLLEIIF